MLSALTVLHDEVVHCIRCPRLVAYREQVGREKRRAYRDHEYWARPVPGFGDPHARVLVLGLAPGAHGSNRTGRPFTGDASGKFMYPILYKVGFASQPNAEHRGDGLKLIDCYITAAIRCAPPKNKPLPSEARNCQLYLEMELRLLKRVRAVLVLGRIAFDTYLRVVASQQKAFPSRSTFKFAHGASFGLPGGLPRLFCSYHPSQQNTLTGRLTAAMFRKVLAEIQNFLANPH